MIISILNLKGGVGKTTLVTNIAVAVRSRGHSVLVVDSDPQGSARDWHSENGGTQLDVIGLDRPTLDKDVFKFAKRYDYVFIDGAPHESTMAVKTLLCSDFVIIPVQPSPYDIWASKDLVDLIKQRQDITGGYPHAAFLISRAIVNTVLGREVKDALNAYDLPILKNATSQRVAYASTAAEGGTVLDVNGEAQKEIILLTDEILEAVNGNSKS
jgi:chromosome partitioning protein